MRGGKRPGAGRPKGASFRDMVSLAEKRKFVDFVLETYMGDMGLARWFGDQIFGRAQESIDHTSKGDKLPTPIMHAIHDNDSDKEAA